MVTDSIGGVYDDATLCFGPSHLGPHADVRDAKEDLDRYTAVGAVAAAVAVALGLAPNDSLPLC